MSFLRSFQFLLLFALISAFAHPLCQGTFQKKKFSENKTVVQYFNKVTYCNTSSTKVEIFSPYSQQRTHTLIFKEKPLDGATQKAAASLSLSFFFFPPLFL